MLLLSALAVLGSAKELRANRARAEVDAADGPMTQAQLTSLFEIICDDGYVTTAGVRLLSLSTERASSAVPRALAGTSKSRHHLRYLSMHSHP